MPKPEFYVAKENATFDYEGSPVYVNAGVTIVRAGHPILTGHEWLFQPLRVHYDMPQPEDDTEMSAPANKVAAGQRGARTRSSSGTKEW